jgi:hypothetical protein
MEGRVLTVRRPIVRSRLAALIACSLIATIVPLSVHAEYGIPAGSGAVITAGQPLLVRTAPGWDAEVAYEIADGSYVTVWDVEQMAPDGSLWYPVDGGFVPVDAVTSVAAANELALYQEVAPEAVSDEWVEPATGWVDPATGQWVEATAVQGWVDPATGEWVEPATTEQAAPVSEGWVDPVTGEWVEPATAEVAATGEGWVDPVTGQWVSASGEGWVDPNTGEWVTASSDGWVDPATGQWVEAKASEGWVDPATGEWIEPAAEEWVDPATTELAQTTGEGWVDPNTGQWVEAVAQEAAAPAQGGWVDPVTGEWVEAAAPEAVAAFETGWVDPATGQWVDAASGTEWVEPAPVEAVSTGGAESWSEPIATAYIAGSNGDGAVCRAGAERGTGKLAILGEGEPVEVRGEAIGEWQPVNCAGVGGYVHTSLIAWEPVSTVDLEQRGRGKNNDHNQSNGGGASAGNDGTASASGNQIVDFAMQYVGYPYAYAGEGPYAFDCSGFTKFVIQNTLGIDITHDMFTQIGMGQSVGMNELRPGDLVFFANTFRPGLSHAGIYIGGGQFVHAENESTGVRVSDLNSDYYGSRWAGGTRLA